MLTTIAQMYNQMREIRDSESDPEFTKVGKRLLDLQQQPVLQQQWPAFAPQQKQHMLSQQQNASPDTSSANGVNGARPAAPAGSSPNPSLGPSAMTPTSATQTSPPSKTTPTNTLIKTLLTMRDHVTDQLVLEGDEYFPREYDQAGEKKITATGHLLGTRDYRCRTFFLPKRGDKLFMMALECAKVLGYRDSFLLFHRNRSLYKIIATQAEKEDLILQEILPFSYRCRQVALLTAKSMFRQFGSRVIVNGRRVRDDYWEMDARRLGLTEEDPA